jgi:hypothetical protein
LYLYAVTAACQPAQAKPPLNRSRTQLNQLRPSRNPKKNANERNPHSNVATMNQSFNPTDASQEGTHGNEKEGHQEAELHPSDRNQEELLDRWKDQADGAF